MRGWKRFLIAVSTLVNACAAIAAETGVPSPELYYVVSPETRRITEISLRLYGTEAKWKQIARWNGMQPPYPLKIGQKLILNQAPTLSQKEGDLLLLELWRRRFSLPTDLPPPPQLLTPEQKAKQELRKEYETVQKKVEQVEVRKESITSRNAQDHFGRGKELFDAKDYEGARDSFQLSRKLNPSHLPSWLFEIRALKLLGKREELEEVTDLLLYEHPEWADLPMFQQESEP